MNQAELAECVRRAVSSAVRSVEFYGASAPIDEMYVPLKVTTSEGQQVDPSAAIRTAITGIAGAGKSVLVKHIAQQMLQHHALPVLLQSRLLQMRSRVQDAELLCEWVRRQFNVDADDATIMALTRDPNTTLIIDGVDEAPLESRDALLSALLNVAVTSPYSRVLVTSRPLPSLRLLESQYQLLQLSPLSSSDLEQFVRHFAGNDRRQTSEFLRSLSETPAGELASTTPLLLATMWIVFRYHGRLPTTDIAAVRYLVNILLQEWDARRDIPSRTRLDAEDVSRFMTNLAGALLTRRSIDIPMELAASILAKMLGEPSDNQSESLAGVLSAAGFVTSPVPRTITFSHRVFFEYFAARAVVESPDYLLPYLESAPDFGEILRFVTQLTPDPTGMVRRALTDGRLFLAAKAASLVPPPHGAAIQKEIRELLERELPFCFAAPSTVPPAILDTATNLVAKFGGLRRADLTSYQKGRLLEDLARDLFGTVMRVIETNLRSEHGEFDLLLENQQSTPFWLEYGAHVMVECKNRERKTALAEVQTFCGKLEGLRLKLGFFISTGGFTRDAIRCIRNHALSSDGAVIVPLDFEALAMASAYPGPIEDFLKGQVRDIRIARKF